MNTRRIVGILRGHIFSALFALVVLVPFGCATDLNRKGDGTVGGSVLRNYGDHIVAATGIPISVSGNGRNDYKTVTDHFGKYAIDLPAGTYRARVHWFGDCPVIHRAAFSISAGEHLSIDFFVPGCGITEPGHVEVQLEHETSDYNAGHKIEELNTPLAAQSESYHEQVFPPDKEGRPEIIVAFGKYDNERDAVTYFSLQNQTIKSLPSGRTKPGEPFLVTLTCDKYTLRSSTIVLNKSTMVFHLSGRVWISDGTHTTEGQSATLFFVNTMPRINIEH